MESDISSLSDLEPEERPRIRRLRIIRDRENPFDIFDEFDFKARYRLNKMTAMDLVHPIGRDIQPLTQRNKSIDSRNQVLIALRFYATGALQQLIGHHIHVHKSTVCRIIKRVTNKIAALSPQYIKMPSSPEELTLVKSGFFDIAGFPRVIGALDCSHIYIQSPGGPDAELYRNRKRRFSLNVLWMVLYLSTIDKIFALSNGVKFTPFDFLPESILTFDIER